MAGTPTKTDRVHPSSTELPSPVMEMPSMDVANLHADLHALTVMGAEESVIREGFRQRIIHYTSALGVAHLIQGEKGLWTIPPEHSSGRVPQREDFIEKYSNNCNVTIQRRRLQLERFLGLQAIFAPIVLAGTRPEVFMVLAKPSDLKQTVFLIETTLEYFKLWMRNSANHDNSWKLTSLAAIVELISNIERCESIQEGGQVVVNDLVRHLPCSYVALGLVRRQQMRLLAVSGEAEMDARRHHGQLLETVLHESWLRDDVGQWPANDDSNEHLLLAHRQLAAELRFDSVYSTPLRTPEGEVIGALLLGCPDREAAETRMTNFVRAAAPRLASALDVVERAQCSRPRRILRAIYQTTRTIKGRIWLGVALVVLTLLFLPATYRVRCPGELTPTTRSYSVAPFDGVLQSTFVEPGDIVQKGQRLAQMDGQEIRYRTAAITAELAQAEKQSQLHLSHRSIPDAIAANLEAARLNAEKHLLNIQSQQIDITCPLDGIVLSSSVDDKEGSAVSTGNVLYEVGPLEALHVDIHIPAEEIAFVQANDPIRLWVEGFESETIVGRLEQIAPSSELKDGRNVFVATVSLDNPQRMFRPGMKCKVRIDCKRHALGWNLFHKPWNYLATRMTWW